MATREELLIEANKRGLLKGKQKEAFDQAVSRGIIKVNQPEQTFSQKVGQSVGTALGETAGDIVGGFSSSVIDAAQGLRQTVNALTGDTQEAEQIKAQREETKRIESQDKSTATRVGEIAGIAAPIIATLPLGAATALGRLGVGAALGGGFAAVESDATTQKEAAGDILKGGAVGLATAGIAEGVARGAKALAARQSQKAAREIARSRPEKITETQKAAERLRQQGLETPRLTTAQSGGDKIAADVERKLIERSGTKIGEKAADLARAQGAFADDATKFVSNKILGGKSIQAIKQAENTLYRALDNVEVPPAIRQQLFKRNPSLENIVLKGGEDALGVADELAKKNIREGTIGQLRAARSVLQGKISEADFVKNKNKVRLIKNIIDDIDDTLDPLTQGQLKSANALTTQRKIVEELQTNMSKIKPKNDGQYAPSQIFDAIFAKNKDFNRLVKRAPELKRQLEDVRIILRRIGLSNLDTASANAIAGKPFGFGAIVDATKRITASTVNDGLLQAAFNPDFARKVAELKRLPSRRAVQESFIELLSDLTTRSAAAAGGATVTRGEE